MPHVRSDAISIQETALVKMNYDILSSLDGEKCTVPVSIDLSATFDTNNHNVFLNRLRYMFGITGIAFKWFQSRETTKFVLDTTFHEDGQ